MNIFGSCDRLKVMPSADAPPILTATCDNTLSIRYFLMTRLPSYRSYWSLGSAGELAECSVTRAKTVKHPGPVECSICMQPPRAMFVQSKKWPSSSQARPSAVNTEANNKPTRLGIRKEDACHIQKSSPACCFLWQKKKIQAKKMKKPPKRSGNV